MKQTTIGIIFLGLLLLFASCEKLGPQAPQENELLDGPIDGLTIQEQQQFSKGDQAFNDHIFTVATGLGPLFVGNSCGSCHAGDGKGHPFMSFTRFGQVDSTGNKFLSQGGPQLQHKAIPGYLPERIPAGATFSKLLAPAITGLGYLDAVSDAFLIALSDPWDLDGDGISGRVHWNTIPDYVTLRPNSISQNGKYITRFGKKGAAYNLLDQTTGAYNQDMGITSIYEPIDPYSMLPQDPEVSAKEINDVVLYLKTLKAPLPRKSNDPDVVAGSFLFTQIKCTSCHTPKMKTGPSPIASLAYKEFYPYTDLLLHDMGPQLDDGYTEGYATTAEWRTPALWGLGLSKDSQGGAYYLMHDGRATSIEQAITMHGGEAQGSRQSYVNLSPKEKKQLLTFLESL